MTYFERNDNEERRPSCIETEEEGELDKDFQDIVELFNDSEKIQNVEIAAKKKKLELDILQDEELRFTFGQTNARKGKESPSKKTKKRPSFNDTIGFLKEKSGRKNEFR